ncbi:PP2C family protein-serine/threonine phosphatase [Streptomyces macrosporus]|uniref:PP2C family protein-serine/threonine phosphatase n=1 Tax=Streptomyces macrosporus TaxID=44032 RepID=A0ABP5WPX3_9ACTN
MESSGRQPGKEATDPFEGREEQLLGVLLDRAYELPPHLVAPLVAEEVARIGGRQVSLLLQDYDQLLLVPLPGRRLAVGDSEPIGDSPAGTAFLQQTPVTVAQEDGVRVYLPMIDGSDQVGVLALTMDRVDDRVLRLLRRLATLVADMVVTKDGYTDLFHLARRREPMSIAGEIQWALLPPLALSVPQAALAGILEPAYDVAGDSFDYALNEDILHVAMIDAMGHGLDAATMASVAIGAYRHARRAYVGLTEIYALMDRAINDQFGPDHFVTAQMLSLDITTGRLQWVNAGHPPPLLIRDHQVVQHLHSPTTLPVGLGGYTPQVSEKILRRGDRILCFTDGLLEEHAPGGEPFGEQRFIAWVNRIERTETGVRAVVRSLSHALKQARGRTTDDATLLLIEWRGGTADHLATLK